jgi:hypothetical protein
MLPHFKHLRHCIYQDETEYSRFRAIVVNSVMTSDIFYKELTDLRNARWAKVSQQNECLVMNKEDMDRGATIVIVLPMVGMVASCGSLTTGSFLWLASLLIAESLEFRVTSI